MSEKKYTSETKDFHPLVAQWLTKNGYIFTHEYVMPDVGRVDFYATHTSNGEILLIEAKLWHGVGSGIMQVINYRQQIPKSKAAVAIPLSKLTDKDKTVSQKYDIEIITFDIGVKPKRERDGFDHLIEEFIATKDREYLWMEVARQQSAMIDKSISQTERLLEVIKQMRGEQ